MTEPPAEDSAPAAEDPMDAHIRELVAGWPPPSPAQLDGILGYRAVPACAYVPLTGPVPPDLGRDEEFTHERVSIGPELAAKLLETLSDRVRKRSDRTVDLFADLMTAGEWVYSPQGRIAVDFFGHVCDGQCILAAIVKSGVTIRIDVLNNHSPF